ncbi:MAG: cupin domain-containing protein [Alphaproteobacteria bacterium]
MVASRIDDVALSSAPIRPEWVISGEPQARAGEWSVSADRTTSAAIWDCTAGTFRWYFGGDEIVQILEGEVIVEGEGFERRALKVGDVALFRANTWAVWHVPHYVRKHAICRDPIPGVLAWSLRAVGRLMRSVLPAPRAVSAPLTRRA